MVSVYGFTRAKLRGQLEGLGMRPFIAEQIFDWVYARRVKDFSLMTSISVADRAKLAENFFFPEPKIVAKQVSADGTVKFLSELRDGARIETVFMPFDYGNSACITTQVGCNMGCKFCASGLLKRERNLDVGEMVMQLTMVQDYLAENKKARLSNYVVMGIGEPFDNFDNLMDLLDISRDPKGLAIGARKITVSTCGIVPKIKLFAQRQPQVNLAISLHAPNDAVRSQLMPINRAYPVKSLVNAAKEYVALTKRRITYEYILIDGVNDAPEHARELAALIQGQLAYVNLIPYNAVMESGFAKSRRVREFHQVLSGLGIPCTVRQEKGADIDAACGQLRAKDRGILSAGK